MVLNFFKGSFMPSIAELQAQVTQLQVQIEEQRKSEISEAVQKVRNMVEEFGLTASDIFPSGRTKAAKKDASKVAAKYRDPETGKTWSGRGLQPKWLHGKDKAQFAI
jgi:DNA-binding protein H-NS